MENRSYVIWFYNCRSGGASLQESDKLRDIAYSIDGLKQKDSKYEVHFHRTFELDKEFYQLLDDCISKNPEYLFIAGGDGTIQVLMSMYIQRQAKDKSIVIPKIAVLPSGTMHNLATTLEGFGLVRSNLYNIIPKRSFSSQSTRDASRIIRSFTDGSHSLDECCTDIPILKVTADGKEDESQYGFIFAGGPLTKFINDYYRRKGDVRGRSSRGAVRAAGSALLTIMEYYAAAQLLGYRSNKFERISGTVRADDKEYYDPLLIAASTIPKLGLFGFHLFYLQEGADDMDHAHAIIADMHPRNLGIPVIAKALRGKLRSHPNVKHEKIERCLAFELRKPLDYLIDSQLGYPLKGKKDENPMRAEKTIEISMGPKIRFIDYRKL